MGFRLRKRIKIAPGINVNIGKRGASVSVGKPGATVNFGGKVGTKATVGIPGTGISYSQQLSKSKRKGGKQAAASTGKSLGFFGLLGYGILGLFIFLVLLGLFSR